VVIIVAAYWDIGFSPKGGEKGRLYILAASKNMGRLRLGGGDFSGLNHTGFSTMIDVIEANTRIEAKTASFTGDVTVLGKLSASSLDANDIENLETFVKGGILDDLIADYVVGNTDDFRGVPGDPGDSVFEVSEDGNRLIAEGKTLDVSGIRADVLEVNTIQQVGTHIILDTVTHVSERVKITNNGTGGPALEVTQTGNVDIAHFWDDSTSAMVIKDGGNVGINTSNPDYKLEVDGSARVGALTFDSMAVFSDRRLKENIERSKVDCIGVVNSMDLYEFNRRDLPGTPFTACGFIAQNVEEAMSSLVNTEANDMKSVQTSDFIPLLVGAVQELSRQNKNLRDKLEAVEKNIGKV